MALIDNYSKEELEQIANISTSFSDFCYKLGYNTNATKTRETIKQRIEEQKIDISHFSSISNGIARTPENTFIENSTAGQSTLRRLYIKGAYTPYICSICGQEPIWQGKSLTLILDHINGKNHDDRLENLRWVCPNCNQQLDTTGSKNCKTLEKKFYCIDCGKEISKKSTRCIECASKQKIITTEELPITREELKKLIRNTPFTKIGEKLNMSDNGIRKWCDKFNLPRTKTEIKKYTDEEWEIL